jgi:protein-S-isoprenylcysteine O-methyltransferase Ste14
LLAAIAWKIKSMSEETLMVQQFGDQYAHYRERVKGLVPYLW